MKRLIIFLLVSLPAVSIAQDLTLQEAVMGQYSKFAPKNLTGAQWLPGTTDIVYFSTRYHEVYKMPMSATEGTKIVGPRTISKIANETVVNHYRGSSFVSENELIISGPTDYYKFNLGDSTLSKLLEFPVSASEREYHSGSNHLAYTLDNNISIATADSREIKVTDNADKNIVSGQSIARSEFGIHNGLFWSPNGSALAFYQKDETNVHDYPLLDISTTPGTLKSIKYPMAGQKSEESRIGIYNLASKKTVFLEVEGDKDQYLTNLAWGPEGKYLYIAVVNRDQNHMQLEKFDASTGKRTAVLFEENHPKYVEPERPVWFIPGTTDFIWFSERDGFDHLYRYTDNGKFVKQLTKGKWEVEEIVGVDAKGKNLIVITTDESGLNRLIRKVNLSSGTTETISKEPGVHTAQLDSQGKYIIDSYSNLDTPGVTQIIDTDGNVIKVLKTAENPYTDKTIGKTELVTVKANDGTILNGRIIKPSSFDANKKYPVLVYVYGGPHAQMVTNSWLAGASLWMHYFAEKGYIIFTLDNRGSANRGLEFENVIHRQLGTVEIEDQMAGVDYLKSLPYVDADRMAVHGWSFGGFMTTSLMLRKPGTFKVGVAGGPVTDWKYYEIMYGERYMDRPDQNQSGYDNASLLTHAKNLQGDLLLIHGTVDDVVVMQHNLSLIQKFVDEGILVDFFPYPGHPHNVQGKDRVHLMNKVLTYIEDHIDD